MCSSDLWYLGVYIDAFEWVELPNTLGMSQYADGGQLASKPYVSSAAYLNRMSDYCSGCHYDRTKRVGDDACPFTTLYWNFLSRNDERLIKNPRIAQQVRAARKLANIEDVNDRAAGVLGGLDTGRF